MHDQEKIYQLTLASLKGVGFNIWHKLITTFGSATNLYETKESILKNISNAYLSNIAHGIVQKENLSEMEKKFYHHQENNVEIISYYDDNYPCRLKEISSPPCFLYKKGSTDLNFSRMIGVVGSRNATNYGKEVTNKIVSDLAQYDVIIVSGLAYGIDYYAHVQALRSNLLTVAVLAGGLDKIYPSVHKPLANEIISSQGCIVSEYSLGTIAESYNFPTRNRIIAGCCDAILVIEAGVKSGSNITAICANDFNREVFAVPGNIGNPLSLGCNNLIKNNQAQLITSADDIATMMNWNTTKQNCKINNNLNETSQSVLNVIKSRGKISIDEMSILLNKEVNQLSITLLQLEMDGYIKTLPGNEYTAIR